MSFRRGTGEVGNLSLVRPQPHLHNLACIRYREDMVSPALSTGVNAQQDPNTAGLLI